MISEIQTRKQKEKERKELERREKERKEQERNENEREEMEKQEIEREKVPEEEVDIEMVGNESEGECMKKTDRKKKSKRKRGDVSDASEESQSDVNQFDDPYGIKVMNAKMRKIVMNEKNKINKNVASELLECVDEYVRIVTELIRKNGVLEGRITESARAFDVLAEQRMKETRAIDRTDNARDGMKKSYAVVVKGTGEMSSDQVREKVMNEVKNDVDVRVKAVRRVKDGIAIEMPSQRECDIVKRSPKFIECGLSVHDPRRMLPRVVAYDVPCDWTDDEILIGLYEKNLRSVCTRDEFTKEVKIVFRNGRKDAKVKNVVFELTSRIKNELMVEGRIYVGWHAFRVNVYERVYRCFACAGFGHRASECKTGGVCWKCGEAGHKKEACRRPEECMNCRKRGMRAGHSVLLVECPIYRARLNMMRARLDDG